MSSDLEDSSSIEKQGYFRYGFGAFMPKQVPFRHQRFPHDHRGRPTWPFNQPNSTHPGPHRGGNLTQNPQTSGPPKTLGASLPDIHVSKLSEKDHKNTTTLMRGTGFDASQGQGESDMDHGYHNTSVWGRRGRGGVTGVSRPGEKFLPSLAAASVFPQAQGKVTMGSPWWEWSKKEFRIKETKFSSPEYSGGGAVYGTRGVGPTPWETLGKGRVLFDGSMVMDGSGDGDSTQAHTGLCSMLYGVSIRTS